MHHDGHDAGVIGCRARTGLAADCGHGTCGDIRARELRPAGDGFAGPFGLRDAGRAGSGHVLRGVRCAAHPTGLAERELRREGLPPATFGNLRSQELILAKTADRSVLGCMNDMAFLGEVAISDAGGLAHLTSAS